eukprot:TRINITY_DN2546_c0_g1_i15.p1 TRINITY_DN2546_c0_g1~~TRINITY_DN2546_c0_g1_i15.p1  ORF type:complete len:235 (-),score=27.03 TRINITY_DN2546_c0_g1_i15:355-1059(-)
MCIRDSINAEYMGYANQSARLYGLDLSGRMPLARTGLGEFGLRGLMNYTKGENRDTGGNLYNIMPLNGKLALTHQYGGWSNALELVGVSGKDDVSSARNEIHTAGYSLTHLRTSYTWKNVRVDLGIENLFDRLYSLPLGGAYTGQGTTMSTTGTYSPAWGIVVPGMGRSIYAGLNVKFQAIDPGKPRPRPGLYHFWTREKHGSDVCHFIPEPTGYTNWCADLLGPRSGKCLAPE